MRTLPQVDYWSSGQRVWLCTTINPGSNLYTSSQRAARSFSLSGWSINGYSWGNLEKINCGNSDVTDPMSSSNGHPTITSSRANVTKMSAVVMRWMSSSSWNFIKKKSGTTSWPVLRGCPEDLKGNRYTDSLYSGSICLAALKSSSLNIVVSIPLIYLAPLKHM